MTEQLAHHRLPDINQTWWQLASIQLAGLTSMPVLISSLLLLHSSNFISAVVNLIIGNIILWLLGFGIIAMSHVGRKSTIDIAEEYLGRFGAYFIAVLQLLSTLGWFVAQTILSSTALTILIPIHPGSGINLFIQMCVALGIISTLLCINGMIALRWLSVISLPVLIVALIITIAGSGPTNNVATSTGISLSGLPLVLGAFLNVTADLPTYFRHSRSWAASIGALSATQIGFFVISLGCLFLGSKIEQLFGVNPTSLDANMFYRVFLIVLIFLSTTCANVSNVYATSVGWELIAPILAGVKEYLILGLSLTTISILVLKDLSMDNLLSISHASITNLCLVLILGYLFHAVLRKPLDVFSKTTFFIAWLTATAINIFQYFKTFTLKPSVFLTGSFTVLLVVGILFSLKELKVLVYKKWS